MSKKNILLSICLLFLFFLTGCGNKVNKNMQPAGTRVIIKIEAGTPAVHIASELEKKGVINDARDFSSFVKSKGIANALQAGEYEFIAGTPVDKIVDQIVKGEVRYVTVVIPEGLNVKQIATLFEEKGFGKKEDFLAKAKEYTPYEYMETDDVDVEYKSEGFLFPATYHIKPGTSQDAILEILTSTFDERLTKEMREKIKQDEMSIREFVIMASLVEKEAAVDEDRPQIAKAFLKRLDIQMPLQSCATIQYILGYPKPELTIADTRLPSPYNTYLHYGLPPGPIANPGMLAMASVLEPSQEDYLYFVAQSNGKHIFSKTYEEHLAVIERASQ